MTRSNGKTHGNGKISGKQLNQLTNKITTEVVNKVKQELRGGRGGVTPTRPRRDSTKKPHSNFQLDKFFQSAIFQTLVIAAGAGKVKLDGILKFLGINEGTTDVVTTLKFQNGDTVEVYQQNSIILTNWFKTTVGALCKMPGITQTLRGIPRSYQEIITYGLAMVMINNNLGNANTLQGFAALYVSYANARRMIADMVAKVIRGEFYNVVDYDTQIGRVTTQMDFVKANPTVGGCFGKASITVVPGTYMDYLALTSFNRDVRVNILRELTAKKDFITVDASAIRGVQFKATAPIIGKTNGVHAGAN